MTIYYAKAAGSVLAANAWNTAADGTGTDATFADGNAAGHTLDLNALAMTSPTGTTLTCTLLRSGATNAGGTLTPTGTLTIVGTVSNSHTSTSGMLIVGAGDNLTITGPGSGVAVTNTSTGYAIVITSTGVVSITNTGATACEAGASSGTGRCVSHGGTGTGSLTITADTVLTVGAGNSGPAIVFSGTGSTSQLTGAVTGNGTGCLYAAGGTLTLTGTPTINAGYLLRVTTGTFVMDGVPVTTGLATVLSTNSTGGTVTWTGSRTLAAATDCNWGILVGATLNLTSLALACSGRIFIGYSSGTLTLGSGGTLAQINLQSSAACAAILGSAHSGAIVGPSVPSAADTRYGITRGYPSDSGAAVTGTGDVAGQGTLQIPNSGTPTGTEDATSDACVVSGKTYGSTPRTGSAATGGGGGAPVFGGNMVRRV